MTTPTPPSHSTTTYYATPNSISNSHSYLNSPTTTTTPHPPPSLNPTSSFTPPLKGTPLELDPILHTLPVYVTSHLTSHLHVFQYLFSSFTSTSTTTPHPLEARIKPRSQYLEFDLQLPTTHPTYDAEKALDLGQGPRMAMALEETTSLMATLSNNVEGKIEKEDEKLKRIEKMTWGSTQVPLKTKYFVGVMHQGAFHLTPIHSVLQFAPNFKHLDIVYQKEKEMKKKIEENEKLKEKATGLSHPSSSTQPTTTTPSTVDKKWFTQLPRIETEEMIEAKKKSMTYWKKERDQEHFVPLKFFYLPNMTESKQVFDRLLAVYQSSLTLANPSKAHFYNTITPSLITIPQVDPSLVMSHPKLRHFPLEDMKLFNLEARLYHLLLNAYLLPFDTLMYHLNPSHPDELLTALTKLAIPIRGVWILASHVHWRGRAQYARDVLISLFHDSRHQPPVLRRSQLTQQVALDPELTWQLFSELAIPPSLASKTSTTTSTSTTTTTAMTTTSCVKGWTLKYMTTLTPTEIEKQVYQLFEQHVLAKYVFILIIYIKHKKKKKIL
ncbi:DNA-directed RNA polymerase III subunit RPC5 [Coelomomyces lativittatus]|nr:DNA-directed RNA polymerase III subunit RPC5 [Coelomomyces lativittatus]